MAYGQVGNAPGRKWARSGLGQVGNGPGQEGAQVGNGPGREWARAGYGPGREWARSGMGKVGNGRGREGARPASSCTAHWCCLVYCVADYRLATPLQNLIWLPPPAPALSSRPSTGRTWLRCAPGGVALQRRAAVRACDGDVPPGSAARADGRVVQPSRWHVVRAGRPHRKRQEQPDADALPAHQVQPGGWQEVLDGWQVGKGGARWRGN
eukprot:354980-Chlamydomonas_euryale.AAC.3